MPTSIFLLFLRVDVLIDVVKALRLRAVHLVPPVADEESLVEERSNGTEERVATPAGLAHVEHLREAEKKKLY